PGTFDPITNGHVDLIQRAKSTFGRVVVLIAHSGKKSPVFSDEERRKLVEKCFPNDPCITVESYRGLLVDYCRKNGIKTVIRGLRAISDFEYEFQMATINQRMLPELQTYFLMASEKHIFI